MMTWETLSIGRAVFFKVVNTGSSFHSWKLWLVRKTASTRNAEITCNLISKSSSSRYWNVYRKPEYPVNDGYCWIEDIADSMNSCSGGKVLSCLHEWRLFAPHPLNAKTCVQGQWKLCVFLNILTVLNGFTVWEITHYSNIKRVKCLFLTQWVAKWLSSSTSTICDTKYV